MPTLRDFVEKFGDRILDAELSFRVFDGCQNSTYESSFLDWHQITYFETAGTSRLGLTSAFRIVAW